MRFLGILCTIGYITVSTFSSLAQMGAGSPSELSAAMLRLFGDHQAFQAKAHVKVTDKSGKELVNTPMDVAVLDGKARFAFDLTKLTGSSMPADVAQMMRSAGMAQIVSIARPDLKQVLLVYPVQKSILRMPMDAKDALAVKDAKLNRAAVGNETIDGHACVKNKVVMNDAEGRASEAFTWNAKDLKDFPVQIQATERGVTSLLKFSNIQFSKPEPAQFDAPSGFREYKNIAEAMQAMMGITAPASR